MLLLSPNLYSQFSNITAFMSTKTGGTPPYFFNLSYKVNDDPSNVKKNRRSFFDLLRINEENLAIPDQTHSDNVEIISNPGIYNNCDALITQKENVYLVISVADCVPIFLYDKTNNTIALVHSGWRGTMKKILSKTVKLMIKEFQSDPKNIIAFIGPSASNCCYEVDSGIAINFGSEFSIKKNTNKYYLDLKKVNYNQLVSNEVPQNNIELSDYCTICNPEIFHSYRRDNHTSGRMLCVLGISGK